MMATIHEVMSDRNVDLADVKSFIEAIPYCVHSYSSNYSTLDRAILAERLDLVELLLDYGADINGQDTNGVSALFMAIQDEALEIVSFMIKRGADVHQRDKNGWSAIHYAICSENQQLVEIIMGQGIDLNVITHNPRNNTLLKFTRDYGGQIASWFEGFLKAEEERLSLTQSVESPALSSKSSSRL